MAIALQTRREGQCPPRHFRSSRPVRVVSLATEVRCVIQNQSTLCKHGDDG